MAKATPLPDLTLNEQELMGTYSEFMPVVMDMLQSFHPETPITGDDLYSFFGLCVGALIDNDSHITTPRDIRLGAETSAVHAVGWAKRFREMRGDDGPSFLAFVLEEKHKLAQPHVHGPGCKHDH
ncbi:hypothetical protein [Sphingomonas immobilis]|uniref:Globin n=1 Tax=Sphingomonas immobilis TaxID=3063997 RepID=A0ABT8ZVZ8_9SPHN|nr:hypothetical protein [Sphingomonas sp. CA1-15]MDO7841755.1 hypothetical protein [Sphingomonas sp. CA1-15]